jgi:hypothetical protein
MWIWNATRRNLVDRGRRQKDIGGAVYGMTRGPLVA